MKKITILGREKHPTKKDPRYDLYRCICENCGREFEANVQNVNSGKTKSCGKGKCHSHFKDITGKKFGFLKVIKQIPFTNKWLTRCICGKEKERYSTYLTCGHTKSCGCKTNFLLSKSLFQGVKSAKYHLFSQYKNQAKRRGFAFNLTFKQFKSFLSLNCYYCNSLPSNTFKKKGKMQSASFIYSGIDRVKNTIGYSKKNSVACCKNCNLAKCTMTVKEFFDWATSIVKHNNLKV